MSFEKANSGIFSRINIFFSENKAISTLLLFGTTFILLRVLLLFYSNPPYLNFFLLFYWVFVRICLLLGLTIFVYNIGPIILMIGQEEMTDREVKTKRKMIIRGVVIPTAWLIAALVTLIFFNDDIFITGALNCYLLALLFFFTKEWENPFSEKF